jgi:hypothetical protein
MFDVMVDLETASTSTHAAVFSIGAVAFDPNGSLAEDVRQIPGERCFSLNVDLSSIHALSTNLLVCVYPEPIIVRVDITHCLTRLSKHDTYSSHSNLSAQILPYWHLTKDFDRARLCIW